ncbi:prephenate dehydrogenase/arogenate dehydrogenase family protein [Candidatus Parcubacteria bacterium]|nr:prephenate dehydrogenase/arogenate dehydrogenase family protein [Candidatus Parcubacteria bacterium]
MNTGIVGYGAFGEFIAKILVKYGNVLVYSKRDISKSLPNRITQTTIKEVAACRVVIMACGLDEMPIVCQKLARYVNTETVVLDVCSVKTKPVEIMKKYLDGKCQLVATHPLFGPQTVKGTNLNGQKIVIYPLEVKDYNQILTLLRDFLRLEIIEMGPEEHDREMALVHALTFFVGRGLLKLDLPSSPLKTGYYQKLLDLVELERLHSIELFKTIERGNPYAAEVRTRFIKVLSKIDEELKDKNER